MRESLEQNIEQRLQQSLSPQQILFARTLEMPGPEFEEEVRRTLDDNPALEPADDTGTFSADPEAVGSTDESSFSETAEQMQMADYASDEDVPFYRLNISNSSPDDPSFEPIVDNGAPSLADQLISQLAELDLSEADMAVGRYIIGNIDDNGYLTRSPSEMSDDLAFGLGIDIDLPTIERLVGIIRTFDPAGVGAEDLRQSLILQLERRAGSTEVDDAKKILTNHYNLFTHKHFDRIAAAAGISDERARLAIDLIRSLNPKPGSVFDSSDERTRQIVPDFEVEPDESGSRLILSMPGGNPHLRVASSFDIDDITIERRRNEAQRQVDRDAYMFIRRKRDEAIDFIRAITMRHETLWRVMTAIMRLQKKFFLTGDPSALRPMILKDVADLTGYNLSVISRATSGKYVATPSGIYPLKFFFNERPKDSVDASSHAILETLKSLMDSENKHKPLSDESLSARLKEQGFDIARRTVTKYRERLGYPVARLRREI